MNIYHKLAEIVENGPPAVFCLLTRATGSTPRKAGSAMIVFQDGSFIGTVGGGKFESLCIEGALALLKNGNTNVLSYQLVDPSKGDPGVCGGEMEVYLEVVGRKYTVLVHGMGHVGKQVALLAKWIGLEVFLIDDRKELLDDPDLERIPDRFLTIQEFMQAYPKHDFNNTFIVLTTRSNEIDIRDLPGLLEKKPKYIGVIGSKRRWLTTCDALIEKGVSEEVLNNVYSPIGLELKSETPEEIAISILAEILAVKNNSSGENMRNFRRKIKNVG